MCISTSLTILGKERQVKRWSNKNRWLSAQFSTMFPPSPLLWFGSFAKTFLLWHEEKTTYLLFQWCLISNKNEISTQLGQFLIDNYWFFFNRLKNGLTQSWKFDEVTATQLLPWKLREKKKLDGTNLIQKYVNRWSLRKKEQDRSKIGH